MTQQPITCSDIDGKIENPQCKKKKKLDFHGGSVVKNTCLPIHWFNSWSRKIPHVVPWETKPPQLWDCALEPGSHHYGAHMLKLPTPKTVQSLCSTIKEATAGRSLHITRKSSPSSPQLQKLCAATKTKRNSPPPKKSHQNRTKWLLQN